MRIATVKVPDAVVTAIVLGDGRAVRAEAALETAGLLTGDEAPNGVAPPSTARRLVALDREQTDRLVAAAERLDRDGEAAIDLAGASFAPPVPDPTQVFCLGLNYAAHAEEAGEQAPPDPEFFVKLPGCLVGHGADIRLPRQSDEIDYEGELVVVVGRRAKDVDVAAATDCIAGFTVMNDVSARDLQLRGSQWLPGKILDTFAPCGPFFTSADDVNWRAGLQLRTRVNGETMQSESTATMLTGPAEAVAYLSTLVTLQPGDLIATGTPAGVGFTRQPPVYLRPRDVVEVEIEGLGTLSNPVVGAAGQPV